jgi:Tfp pilus assembly protein PilF
MILVIVVLLIVGGAIVYFKKSRSREGMYERAMTYLKEEKVFEAEQELNKLLAKRPDYAEAHAALGDVFLLNGEDDKALAAYKKALELKSDFGRALERIGTTYLRRDDRKKALQVYKKLKKIDDKLANLFLTDVKMMTVPADEATSKELTEKPKSEEAELDK